MSRNFSNVATIKTHPLQRRITSPDAQLGFSVQKHWTTSCNYNNEHGISYVLRLGISNINQKRLHAKRLAITFSITA